MTTERFRAGLNAVKGDIGKLYPVWRIPLFVIGMEHYFQSGEGVCSEETGKFMKGAGFNNIVYGLTPDDLGLLWKNDIVKGKMKTVFDKVLEPKEPICSCRECYA